MNEPLPCPCVPTIHPPDGPDIGRMRAAVRAQLFGAMASADDDDVIAGRYRLEHRIGSGSMATVWRAIDEREGRVVALKLLRSRELFAGTAAERLLREARLLGAIDHPGIVRVLDGGRHGDGGAYVAMELIAGESLAERIARTGAMPWARARVALLQIADALAAAHAAGVIHRDLKPANVLVVGDGDALQCKLIDFGLARANGVDPSTGRITGTGLVFGTPRYMSPEHVRGDALDARADVYSFGCLAYELLTGVPAVAAETIADVLLAQIYRHPRPFAEVAKAANIPEALESIVRTATRKAPELRFPDMAAIHAALLAVDRDASITVPAEELPPYPGRPGPATALRSRAAWIVLALTGIAVVTAAGMQVMP